MDPPTTSRRTRNPPPKSSELYSTVVVRDNSEPDQQRQRNPRNANSQAQDDDLYATVVYRNDDDDDDDDASLPPLLKRLPKDFGGGAPLDFDDVGEDDDDPADFGTVIIKSDRNRPVMPKGKPRSAPLDRGTWRRRMDDGDDDDGDGNGDFSTFVVSGTVVSRTSGGGGGSTMGMAVASMQAVGDLGFGKQGRGSCSSSQGEEARGRMRSKISTSSILESVTREDPSTKYELLYELGKGSYGSVYKARDIRTSELVAIKVISLSEGEEGYEEIHGEIEMLQQCSHPNVVRYLGSYQGEEYLWIVMEYCGGGSVADLMNVTEESLEEYQIAYICREALKGLSYLHTIFKVHRDIKGGNILLTEQGEVKLGRCMGSWCVCN